MIPRTNKKVQVRVWMFEVDNAGSGIRDQVLGLGLGSSASSEFIRDYRVTLGFRLLLTSPKSRP